MPAVRTSLLQNNLEVFARAVGRLNDISQADLPRDTVDMIVAEKGVAANIAALERSIEMNRNIVDLLA